MMFMRFRLLLFLLFGGLILTFWGHSEYKQSRDVRAEPDRITCKTFDKRGPTDNKHVELVAFQTSQDEYYAYMSANGNQTHFALVLVPVYPRTRSSEPAGDEYRTILQFHDIHGEEELHHLLEAAIVRGVVAGRGTLLSHAAQEILTEGYPGIDFHACRIIQVDGLVPNAWRGIGLMCAGVGLVLGFGGYMFWAFKSGHNSNHWKPKQKVNTADPNYMKKRMPTEMDPERFRQNDKTATPSEPTENEASEEEDDVSQNEEDLAYRREFAERYGIGNGMMDELDKDKDDDSWTPTPLNY